MMQEMFQKILSESFEKFAMYFDQDSGYVLPRPVAGSLLRGSNTEIGCHNCKNNVANM